MRLSKKKILITGAGGFIGSHLVDVLIEKKLKSQLLLMLLPDEPMDNLLHHPDLEIVRGDIRDANFINKIMKNVGLVYHLAARIDFDGKTYAEYEDVNVTGTRNLVDAAIREKVQKFIFYSSIGVHGLPAGIGNIENWDELHPPTYTNFYGQSKWEAEEYIRDAHAKSGLAYTIIRPASVYGPREKGPTLALYRAIKNGHFAIIGTGKNKMHYVYVRDLVEATYLAGTSPNISGEYIIAGAEPTTFTDVVKHVALSCNAKIPTRSIPLFIANILAYVAQCIMSVTGMTLPIFPSRVRTMTTSYFYNISKAKKELGYQPKVTFAKGAKLTGDWYLEHNYL